LNPDRDKRLAGLITKAQQGDQIAYEEFLTETAITLRRFLMKRVDCDVVEDVLQDTLLSIHRYLHTYLPHRPVGPWIYAICGNRIADFYRRKRRIERFETVMEVTAEPETETISQSSRSDGTAIGALNKLPDRQRRIIELLKIYGLSVKEVASQTGMSESSVKVTAFRGYEAIRKLMGVKR
jgi:RNA polymerase sigma-70 factor (ECF subfamily)